MRAAMSLHRVLSEEGLDVVWIEQVQNCVILCDLFPNYWSISLPIVESILEEILRFVVADDWEISPNVSDQRQGLRSGN